MAEKKSETRQSSKPSLTGDNVNQVLGAIFRLSETEEQASKLKENWRAFIQSEFRLSRTQQRNLQSIPTHEVEKIQEALNQGVEQGGEIELVLGSELKDLETPANASGKLTIKYQQPAGAASNRGIHANRGINLIIFHCSFDANCGNWRCGLGPG